MRRKLQEWLADRVRWVQYPKQEHIPRNAPPAHVRWQLRWKYPLPLLLRINLALAAIFCIVVLGTLALVLIYLFGLFAWTAWGALKGDVLWWDKMHRWCIFEA